MPSKVKHSFTGKLILSVKTHINERKIILNSVWLYSFNGVHNEEVYLHLNNIVPQRK